MSNEVLGSLWKGYQCSNLADGQSAWETRSNFTINNCQNVMECWYFCTEEFESTPEQLPVAKNS